MKKVLALIVALAAFAAIPAIAAAQQPENDESDQPVSQHAHSNNGGIAGNQSAICNNRGNDPQGPQGPIGNLREEDENGDGDGCHINQSQRFTTNNHHTTVFIDRNGNGVNDRNEGVGVGGGNVTSGGTSGVGGGSVHNLGLARTGFDAWVLALVGGAVLAGGIGLLTVQRRRHTS